MSETATQSGDTPTGAESKAGDTQTGGGSNASTSQTQHHEESFNRGFAKASAKADKLAAELQAAQAKVTQLENQGKTAEELQSDLEALQSAVAEKDAKLASIAESRKAELEARAERLDEKSKSIFTKILEAGDIDLASQTLADLEALKPNPTSSQHEAVPQTNGPTKADLEAARAKGTDALRKFYEENGGAAGVAKILSQR